LVTYRVAPGTSGPITLPSGYQPQCNPCCAFKSPWKIIVLPHNPGYSGSMLFTPIKSAVPLGFVALR